MTHLSQSEPRDPPLSLLGRVSMLLMALLAVAGIATFDFLAGTDISLSLFYLIPVCVVTWYVNRAAGVLISMFSTASVASEYFTGMRWAVHPLIAIWQICLHLGFMLTVIYLLDRLHTALIDGKRLASTDPLTGVLNRRAFMDRFSYILHLAARESTPVTLGYVDLDDFKQINDRKGHAEGDRVLRLLALTLAESVRSSDLVCRLGGDEFALLLPDADRYSAEQFVAKLKQALVIAFCHDNPVVTCSIGCVTFRRPPASPDAALQAADALMYRVKHSGKNAIAFDEVEDQHVRLPVR